MVKKKLEGHSNRARKEAWKKDKEKGNGEKPRKMGMERREGNGQWKMGQPRKRGLGDGHEKQALKI
jgi:hypothetical protein